MPTYEGRLLLASPELLDPNFVHAVVFLVEHNESGALGLVLNRPTSKTVEELWQQVGQSPCDSSEPVHLGGPVSGPLMALHSAGDLAEMEIVSGVFFAAKKQNLDELVRRSDDCHCKIFVGHAGWGPGQLESEIEQGAWQILAAEPQHVFGDPDGLWERLMAKTVGSQLPTILGIKHVPPDPTMN